MTRLKSNRRTVIINVEAINYGIQYSGSVLVIVTIPVYIDEHILNMLNKKYEFTEGRS